MAVQLPDIQPLATNLPQAPNALEQYGRMLQLKTLMGQQQLQPYQMQEAQQRVQQNDLALQQQKLEIDSRKALMDAVASGALKKYIGTPAGGDTGFDANGAWSDLVTNYKVLPEHATGLIDPILKRAQMQAEIAKTVGQAGEAQASIRAKGFDVLHERVADVIENPKNATQLLSDLTTNRQLFDGVPLNDLAIAHDALVAGDTNKLKAAAGALDIDKKLTDFHKAKAETAKAELGIAAPSAAQLTTFTTKTLPGFGALRPEQKQAFTAEATTARTVDELNKVVERADATDKAEQMHRDSLAQTEALKGQTFAQQGLKENDKTWTDPQHGYLQTLSQAKLGKAAIKAGADGNGLLTSLEPTMAVLGMNSFAGTHRISPAEATAAGAPGGWSERFTAWVDKAAAGKLSPQLAKEGTQLFDQLIDAKYATSLQASAMHAKGYNIPAASMPVMDREGNLSTLDKAPKVKAPKPSTATTGGAFNWADMPQHQ